MTQLVGLLDSSIVDALTYKSSTEEVGGPVAQQIAPGSVSEANANSAMRLGWMFAEVMGRLRPDAPSSGTQRPHGLGILPLDAADERSAVEMQVESTKVLMSVAKSALVDFGIDSLTGQRAANYPGVAVPLTTSSCLAYLVCRLIHAREPRNDLHATLDAPPLTDAEQSDSGKEGWWKRIDDLMWVWDAAIQDSLATRDFGTASAYQLGRGLAEAYWALDPKADPGSPHSWSFLLGKNRSEALSLLCRRLAASIGAVASAAVAASVEAWQIVAETPDEFQNTVATLGEQLLIWRDLLLTQRDPTSYVDKNTIEKESRKILPLLLAFRWELVLGAAASVLLGWSAFHFHAIAGSIGTFVSAFGITAAAVGARAKAIFQSVGQKVQGSLSQAVVTEAVVHTPTKKPTGRLSNFRTHSVPEPLAAMKP